ncbi:MAG: hypothetical protein Q8N98_03010, partial [bacterium]|nr:hypothetical protein [bacterium]
MSNEIEEKMFAIPSLGPNEALVARCAFSSLRATQRRLADEMLYGRPGRAIESFPQPRSASLTHARYLLGSYYGPEVEEGITK